MIKYYLLFVFTAFSNTLLAQPGETKDPAINRILKAMSDFQQRENKRDSLLNHPLGSNNEADQLRRYRFSDSLYNAMKQIPFNSLSPDGKINLALLQYEVEEDISNYEFKSYLNPILSDEGFHTGFASMGGQILTTKKELGDYIQRLKDLPRATDEYLALMREGLRLGICQPRVILDNYANTYQQHIVDNYQKSVFWAPLSIKPVAVSDSDWELIRSGGKLAIEEYAIPAYKKIKAFFDEEYLPKTRTTIGVSHFPKGLEYYQDRTKHYTTTNMTYEQVYELGLFEVARIKNEMFDVMRKVNFTGSLQEFITQLRTDPRFYATTPEQLLKEASYHAKKADGCLPRFFGKLPRQPYGVEAVPAHLAPTYTGGRYSGAPLNSRRAAHYWVNTYDLKSRSLYNLEALTLHEAVPGHHLQIALTKELDSLPRFRRNLYVNAFGEGWGLYSEWLGTEMGFYKDPYSLFGKLTYEMWRACRLVVDVALHTKGWTREQAVKYLSENTALSLHEVNTEINRYISWPGQALAYKMGELKIRELRKKAEEQLKDKFDIREFHDLVLSQGTVTLEILEGMVEKWIEGKK
jgi:uncharacterized protein (DUF885 family)